METSYFSNVLTSLYILVFFTYISALVNFYLIGLASPIIKLTTLFAFGLIGSSSISISSSIIALDIIGTSGSSRMVD